MGFLDVLTIIFVVLKLLGVINWSWWLVFSPVLIAVALGIVEIIVRKKHGDG